jgi:hypothetical protein
MKIYQLISETTEKYIVLGTFLNEDDALNGLADWTENSRALNEALENAVDQDHEDVILDNVPEYYFPWDDTAKVIEYEVLEKYDKSIVKL